MVAAEEADPGTVDERQRKLDADLAAVNARPSREALKSSLARMQAFGRSKVARFYGTMSDFLERRVPGRPLTRGTSC